VQQNAAVEIGYGKPPPRPKGIPRQIAEETGLSVDTVRRALAPKPAPEPGERQGIPTRNNLPPPCKEIAVPYWRSRNRKSLTDRFSSP
jgi:hypothetical protein